MMESFLPLKILSPEWELPLRKTKHRGNCLKSWLQMYLSLGFDTNQLFFDPS